ncbi:hypothetical protein ACLG6S_13980 [Thermodesulfobacteriota bacterium B35]
MESFTITGKAEEWLISRQKNIYKFATGPGWLDSFTEQWRKVMVAKKVDELIIDLGNISFVTLFEWTTVVALIHKIISEKNVPVKLNLFHSQDKNLLKYSKFLDIKTRCKVSLLNDNDYQLYIESLRIDNIGGFIHALGTYNILNDFVADSSNRMFFYDTISSDSNYLKSFYVNEDQDTHTVVHGLTKVQKKQDCTIYLDDGQILDWRRAMGKRFNFAHVFQSEELWRVMCHELTANIIEHAQMPGFLSARVIIPESVSLQKTFRFTIGDDLWAFMKKGFVELCISDAGTGIATTLNESFKKQCKSFPESPKDIIAFAFDEFGTSKSGDEGFRTERHALGRILHVISRYGGTITIRTDKVDLIYRSTGGSPDKREGSCGYEPSEVKNRKHYLPGTHIQLLLPLHPVVDRKKRVRRKSLLYVATPESFMIPSHHVHSHLVPLLEQLNSPEIDRIKDIRQQKIAFRLNCEKLCKSLQQKRPAQEPMVFDFSGLSGWTSAHFETLLYYLQNTLINRPYLLVELPENLAQEVHSMEVSGAASSLTQMIPPGTQAPSERRCMEAFGRIHSPVLGFDTKQRPYIFGLLERELEPALLDLLDNPCSIAELLDNYQNINEPNLRAILCESSPLFSADKNGIWNCVWDAQSRVAEINRAMSRYFDSIAERTKAWRGKSYTKQSIEKKFNLSWQNEWRIDFLESSRFLTHERYVDEAAQRLIYRLQYGLTNKLNRPLADVKVLASITGPAMLLATAMHRWWPFGEVPPIVVDFSYYALKKKKDIPLILSDGGIVIVQDILDRHSVSGNLIRILQENKYNLLCTIGLIHLQKNITKTTITPFDKGWNETPNPFHALIDVPSPKKCSPPPVFDRDKGHYWIEPRSLHPVSYNALRRTSLDRPRLARRKTVLQQLDEVCAIMSGHFVVGERHYPVAIDVRKALLSSIGDEISLWLADVCAGNLESKKDRKHWEREENKKFKGEVTVVLMPLHSQIHYLWTKISNILAQRGRRQPMILLDASLFTGRAPSYWVPRQFEFQLEKALISAKDAIFNDNDAMFKPVRILIIDDAVTTAKTAKTILNSIQSCYRHILTKFNKKICNHQINDNYTKDIKYIKEKLSCREYHPIQWIRYFTLLDQMDISDHLLWQNLHSTGDPPVPFILESFAPFMGVPVFREKDCPICRDRRRLERLKEFAEKYASQPKVWIEKELEETIPVAIDGNLHREQREKLEKGIQIFPYRPAGEYYPRHADTATWRFYELMYSSYPINDILFGLENAFPSPSDSTSKIFEYEKYRWSVLGWCLRNWEKVKVFTSGREFVDAAKREIDNNTPLVEKIIDLCSCNYEDECLKEIVTYCIKVLTDLEYEGHHSLLSDNDDDVRVEKIDRIKTGLYLFFMNIMQRQQIADISGNYLQVLEEGIEKLERDAGSICHIFHLYSLVTQPVEKLSIGDIIGEIAQTLFRGRDQDGYPTRHNFLPKLLSEILADPTKEYCMLLDREVRKFLSQVVQLSREFLLYDPTGVDNIGDYCKKIIKSLTVLDNCNYLNAEEMSSLKEYCRDLSYCIEIRYNGDFAKQFCSMFYPSLTKIKKILDKSAGEIENFIGELKFNKYNCNIIRNDGITSDKIIAPVDDLVRWIRNYSIKPIRDIYDRYEENISKIKINVEINIIVKRDLTLFEILSNYDKYDRCCNDIEKNFNWVNSKNKLERFGIKIYDVRSINQNDDFTCRLRAAVPQGYQNR